MMAVTIFNLRYKCVFKLINNLWNFRTACLSPNKSRIVRPVNETTCYRACDYPINLIVNLVQCHHRNHS